MQVIIRKGTRLDLPAALQLIHELADYEREPNAVQVTLHEMEDAGFGSQKMFDFFVAEMPTSNSELIAGETDHTKIVGLALYYNKYSTWNGPCLYLEDLIVTESCRRLGIGLKLFEAVRQVANKQGAKRFQWQVLDWNEPAIEFYKKLNAELDGDWINCQLVNP